LYDRCITLGVVGSVIPKIYGNGHRIIQAPGYVAFLNEMVHEYRIIPLDGRPHLGSAIQTYMGDSRGRWEGNTLVVETTNLNGKAPFLPSRKIIERFTSLEAELLRYEALLDDPAIYTRPLKVSIPLTSPPGYQVLPYDCHEGNKALMQALGGERAEDRALEEEKKIGRTASSGPGSRFRTASQLVVQRLPASSTHAERGRRFTLTGAAVPRRVAPSRDL
jgi:hypothetical protein